MTGSQQKAARWLTGRAEPPTWFRLLGCLVLIAVAAGVAVKRGAVVGALAAVVYGWIGLSTLLAWQRTANWEKRHPLLDSLLVVPLLFFAIAYITNLSTGICLLIALLAGLVLVGLGAARRHVRHRRNASRKPPTLDN